MGKDYPFMILLHVFQKSLFLFFVVAVAACYAQSEPEAAADADPTIGFFGEVHVEQRVTRIVAAASGNDGNATRGLFDTNLDHAMMLGI